MISKRVWGEAMERVAEFNSKYPVGSEVHWRRANGTMTDATVRNAAEVKRGLGAVVWLDGIAGPKSLDRIEEAR